MASLPDIEVVAAEVHASWMQGKLAQGITSRKAENGEELMVPYADLSEPQKEQDRSVVRTVYAAIEKATPRGPWRTLAEINDSLRTSRENPDHREFGYIFFFRGYIESHNIDKITGACLAYPTEALGDDWRHYPVYYCMAGDDSPSQISRGEMLDVCRGGLYDEEFYGDGAEDRCRAAKDKSMTALIAHVRAARGV
jgi:hypothetical protein